ncbi:sigma-70 family RNA polymerase sigma factor [Lignipirellula cremea]|uniref:ECF sigma factor n=1 Tax=Lignipirellula cremea TaxID=2528010 RepID=A0A518DYK7_9BACT|nr:sigma-70 family RNA polymerase sigma factor [Lignipirellula cremea]QDU96933.1 ECF sigma factor [Lignipirellula cremea]
MPDDEVTLWILNAQQGGEDACRKLWEHYVGRLLHLARRKISNLPKSQFDENDIVQSTMNSFFQYLRDREETIEGRDELWRLLATITGRKAIAAQRKVFAKKRRPQAADGDGTIEVFDVETLITSEPTPEFAAELAEECELLLNKLEKAAPLLRKIAELKLNGHTNRECAEICNTTERTIERKLNRIRLIGSEQNE